MKEIKEYEEIITNYKFIIEAQKEIIKQFMRVEQADKIKMWTTWPHYNDLKSFWTTLYDSWNYPV